MPPEKMEALTSALRDIEQTPPKLYTARDPARLISLTLPESVVSGIEEGPVNVSLIVPKAKDQFTERRLSGVKLHKHSSHELFLTGSAEHTLQIHSAAYSSQWIWINVWDKLRILGPLPDLSIEGSFQLAHLEPRKLLRFEEVDASGIRVPIRRDLAATLTATNRWFALPDDRDWIAILLNQAGKLPSKS